MRVAAAHRRDPPEVLPGEQLLLDRADGTTDQCDLRARQGGGKVGVEGPDVQVRVTESDGELPQVAQVVVKQAVEVADEEPPVRLHDVLRLEGRQLLGILAQGGHHRGERVVSIQRILHADQQVHEPHPGPEQVLKRHRVQAVFGEHHAPSVAEVKPAQMPDLIHGELGVDFGVRVVQDFPVRGGRVEPDVVADDVRPADVQVLEFGDIEYRAADRHPVGRTGGVVGGQFRYLEAAALLGVTEIGGEDVLAETSVGHQLTEEFRAVAGHDAGQCLAHGDRESSGAAHIDEGTATALVRGAQQIPQGVCLGADHVVYPAPLPALDNVALAVEADRGIGAGEGDGKFQPARGGRRVQICLHGEFFRCPDPQVEPVLAGTGARGDESQEGGDPRAGREHHDGRRRIGRQPEPRGRDDLQRQPVLAFDARPAQEMRCRSLPFARV